MFTRILRDIYKPVAVAAITALMVACSGSPHWTVDGKIDGAEGKTMIVEANDNGRWYPIDSVTLDRSGKFSVTHAPAGYPDIYRLRLDDKTVYFPIDSIETVTVVTTASAFDSDYTLSGSPSAERLMTVDRRVADAVQKMGVSNAIVDSLFKRELGSMMLQDPSGIVSYYIINKRIGGVQLFDPSRPSDLKIIGAVANAFNTLRPEDPRTAYLRNLFLQNRTPSASAPRDTVHASVINLFDISLLDNRGRRHSLEQLSRQGKVIVLNFTSYQADESPAFNRELNRLYEKYHERGLEIFQVAFDEDEFAWRQAAAPLPWITVYNSAADGASALVNYNVGTLPATFVIDRNGDVVARPATLQELEGAVASRL